MTICNFLVSAAAFFVLVFCITAAIQTLLDAWRYYTREDRNSHFDDWG